MLSLGDVKSISTIIILMLTYFISVIPAGFFKAWVAKKMGDDTGERLGFLSFQPTVYIDWIGLMCLFLFRFGWGQAVPINRYNIHGPLANIKFAFAYLSSVFAHIVIAVLALIGQLFLFGPTILRFDISAMLPLGRVYPEASSLAISLGMVFFYLLSLNIALASIRLIFHAIDIFFILWFDAGYGFAEYRSPIAILTTIVIYVIVGGYIYMFIAKSIYFVATVIAHALGAF